MLTVVFLTICGGQCYGADKINSQDQGLTQQNELNGFKANYVRIVSVVDGKEKVEGTGIMANDWASGGMDLKPMKPIVMIFRDAIPQKYSNDGLEINNAYVENNGKMQFIRKVDSNLSIDEAAILFGIADKKLSDKNVDATSRSNIKGKIAEKKDNRLNDPSWDKGIAPTGCVWICNNGHESMPNPLDPTNRIKNACKGGKDGTIFSPGATLSAVATPNDFSKTNGWIRKCEK